MAKAKRHNIRSSKYYFSMDDEKDVFAKIYDIKATFKKIYRNTYQIKDKAIQAKLSHLINKLQMQIEEII